MISKVECCVDASQTTVHGADDAARDSAERVQGQQTSVHGERGTDVEAPQWRPEQPPQGVPHLHLPLPLPLLQPPIASQLRLLLQPPGLTQITMAPCFQEADHHL